MKNELISVLMPAFNHERYVEESVRSVMAQDWPRIELVVVDDGSKDATWSVLQRLKPECEARCERTVMVTRANRGTRATLQELVALARGDILTVLASDDSFLPGAFTAMMAEMAKDRRIGLVVGRNELMDAESRRCYWDADQNAVYDPAQAVYRDFNEQVARTTRVAGDSPDFGRYGALMRANHVPNGQLVRRRFWDACGPIPAEAPLDDHWMMIQLSKLCAMRMIATPTFRYRWHGANSITQRERMRRIADETILCEERRLFAAHDRERILDYVGRDLRGDFDLGRLLRFRRYRTPFAKIRTVTVLGHDFIFRKESGIRA